MCAIVFAIEMDAREETGDLSPRTTIIKNSSTQSKKKILPKSTRGRAENRTRDLLHAWTLTFSVLPKLPKAEIIPLDHTPSEKLSRTFGNLCKKSMDVYI